MAYNPNNPNGQATMANSSPVVLASDQSSLNVSVQNAVNVSVQNSSIPVTKSGTWTLDANSGVDIGDVTINNGSGSNSVNIQDGGNSITVDGSVSVLNFPSNTIWKSGNYTTAQTGTAIWTPSAGLKVAVTYMSVASYGTTSGRVIIWLGASADTTYTPGTDQLVWAGSFVPSVNSTPGAIISVPFGILSNTANNILRITTDAAISLDLTVYGYEF